MIPKLTNNDWKIRKEGLENLEELLKVNQYRIKCDGLLDFWPILKARIIDSNKSIVRGFVPFTAKFFEAAGKDIKMHAKDLVRALIQNLSDKQNMIRTDVIVSLD